MALIPPFFLPDTSEGALRLAAFRPIRYTWGGGQRRGMAVNITDATDAQDHINKAVTGELCRAYDISLPTEIDESISFSTTAPTISMAKIRRTN